MAEKQHPQLMVPALKAFMGCWVYYIGFMKMRDIADRISIVGDIHTGTSLQEFLQRQLSDRSVKITDYLLNQEQRLFNSLVVGTYGGKPEWFELGVKAKSAKDEELLLDLEGKVGFLKLSGAETLFAIDGQHRIAGIKGAIEKNKNLEEEEVSVIFVAGVIQNQRLKDPQGFERTRRLFTTLNRYAKPVNKKDIIALDEDDVVAIITRKLIEEYPLFKDKVSSKGVNSIHANDKVSLTTIINLYDITNIYLDDSVKKLKFEKRIRPSDEDFYRLYEMVTDLWAELTEAFEPIGEVFRSKPEDLVASKYRNKDGGDFLFRPIGLKMLIIVIVDLCKEGLPIQTALNRLKLVERRISEEPWAGLIWNSPLKRMIASAENQKAARLVLLNSVGGDLVKAGSNKEKLTLELAGLMNRPEQDIRLPKYI
jgi:DNA sulfur modification protein DndB